MVPLTRNMDILKMSEQVHPPNLALAGVDVIPQASLIKIAEEPEWEQGLAQVAKEIKYQRKLIDIVAKPKTL